MDGSAFSERQAQEADTRDVNEHFPSQSPDPIGATRVVLKRRAAAPQIPKRPAGAPRSLKRPARHAPLELEDQRRTLPAQRTGVHGDHSQEQHAGKT